MQPNTPSKPARGPLFQPKILTTLRDYDTHTFLGDLFAGLTVALVALPLSIAIAIASGAEPGVGLVTAVVGGFVISALGGSRVQIGGPTGAFIVVVYGVIAEHGYDGLVTATFMAGIILVVSGWLRIGNLIRHVPEPVINGFTVGIAIIIAVSQFRDAFGLQAENLPAEFVAKMEGMWAVRETFSLTALMVTVGTGILIVLLRRLAPRLPGIIFAVILASLAVWAFGLPVETIGSRYGEIQSSLPAPRLPDLSPEKLVELFPSAFIIAFLAGIESLLSAIVADRMVAGKHRPNAEVVAQGIANTASALFAGLPATGAIARTATNVRAGGRTPVAGIAHALFILVFMLVAAPLANYLPMPALAAILLLTAWNMAEMDELKNRLSPSVRISDRGLLVLTMVLTVLVDLTVAIGVGVAIGLALRIRRRDIDPPEWHAPHH
ncbi:SulP family inorganic anion transporter [Oricola thermophila]|uniref:SulP family inorganic anion transporter n=1 Tax=Oricola thermophila TaxID=2742145 RepID=A0A6N1VG16_9HYPH|nr:SulP family inorganic anion transporter [Oricola thermophila]QKV19493.1 SulP family inorganic anion transporter [Oricola thermophila]